MAARLQVTILARTMLALSVALSGAAPAAYAGVPAPRPLRDEAALSSLLLEIQSVDPGDPDAPDPDPDPDTGGDGNGGGNNGGRDSGRSGLDRPDRPVRSERLNTDRIIEDILSIRRECRRYEDVYRIDCLRQGLEMAAANIPDRPENRDAKRILRRAAQKLGTIVSTYEDDDAPLLEVPRNANPRFKKRRTYRAVMKKSLPRAMAKARVVIDEASTQLLRSAENSERRYAHYQQISAAVDSTKTLLRSG
jgi:hypothetical protein